MSYDENLAERIDQSLKGKRGITQKKMFGGLCFLSHGNMLCGVVEDKLMARVGPDAYEYCLKLKHAEPMDFTGKPMKGMVYVLPGGIKTQAAVQKWVDRSVEFVKTLPKKEHRNQKTRGKTLEPSASRSASVRNGSSQGTTKNQVAEGVVHQVPDDLKKALVSNPDVLEKWNSLTPLARNEWICWTTIVKKAETREEHIVRLCSQLLEGKRRPCCWPGCPHRRPNARKWFR